MLPHPVRPPDRPRGRPHVCSGDPRTRPRVWPRVWSGDRRARLVLLVGAGATQATLAGAAAVLVSRSLRAPDPATRNASFGLLLSVALVGGLLRAAERAVAERLGQSYVHDVRVRLLRVALAGDGTSSLGVTVSRATNDLGAVKSWLSLGLAPLLVGAPAVAGVLGALALTAPALALAVAVPVAVMGAGSVLLTPWGFTRARELRRRRGRLSSRVADAVLASDSIRSGGGVERELRRLAGASREVADAAVARAEASGALRGLGVATATASSAAVVWTGSHVGLPVSTVAGALTVVGFLSGPLHDLSRVVDQRQSLRAARRSLTPGLTGAPPRVGVNGVVGVAVPEGDGTPYGVLVLALPAGASAAPGATRPHLVLGPGERLLVAAPGDRGDRLVRLVAGLDRALPGEVVVDGLDLSLVDGRVRRGLVGHAGDAMTLVPGTVARTLGYRVPDATAAELDEVLDRVGLGWCRELPDGLRTRLAGDGAPLSRDERARLVLARALLRAPAVLVVDHLDRDLDADGRRLLRGVVADYPGVVVGASDDPDGLGADDAWRTWGPAREACLSAR